VQARLRSRWTWILIAAIAALGAGTAFVLAAKAPPGVIGPDNRIQPSGRLLDPVGKLTELGNLPTGAALTADGRFAWTLSAGRGRNDIRVVRVRSSNHKQVGKVVQKISMPGLSGGIAISPDGRAAYVSGTPEGGKRSNEVADDVPGQDGDVIHVFKLNRRSGRAKRDGVIEVPAPPGTLPPQSFPPTATSAQSWPQDLAISPDGTTLLAALNLANAAAIVDTATRAVRYTQTGRYPYGAAITSDGKLGLVSNQTDATVSVIELASGDVVKQLQVGPHLSHPEGIAVDPKRPLAYVAVTNQDLIAVLDTDQLTVERTLSVERPKGLGTQPVDVSVTADGCRLLSADSGEDAIAVFALSARRSCDPSRRPRRPAGSQARGARQLLERESVRAAAVAGEEAEEQGALDEPLQKQGKRWQLLGRVPVASYPTAAMTTPQRNPAKRKLVWVAAKGLGVGPNEIAPGEPAPVSPANSLNDEVDGNGYRYYYLPELVQGMSGITRFPSDARLARLTPRAAQQIRPSNSTEPPEETPLTADGPIKHVFYIVRENRTYDQILGDEPRGDGDPNLTVFGKRVTPNIHALVQRFPLLDHVYANSEASIDGHFWTSAGAVSDYVVKAWHANYADRDRPYDFGVYSVSWPAAGFLFDQAEEQGISWFNYGEAVAGTVPLNDLDRTAEENAQVVAKFGKSDLGPLTPGPQPPAPAPCFTNDAGTGVNVLNMQEVYDSSRPPGANPLNTESRFQCFEQRFNQQLSSDSLPAFNYITYANDHTEGTTPGRRTPDAMVAANDLAVGETVDLISHSPIWDSSLILVVEDDSQDGADHVDAHRMPALAISPWTKRGKVDHTRYDFLSFIRTMELVIGMKPLNLFDATAVPMYKSFDADASDNSEPYDAITPDIDLTATNTASSPAAKLSDRLPLEVLDQVPQRVLDRILWKYRYGADAQPPPPGPNASGLDELDWHPGRISDEEALSEVIEDLGLDRGVVEARYGDEDDDG
jgi:DNA-binding beta-propeller fold protein YncE